MICSTDRYHYLDNSRDTSKPVYQEHIRQGMKQTFYTA